LIRRYTTPTKRVDEAFNCKGRKIVQPKGEDEREPGTENLARKRNSRDLVKWNEVVRKKMSSVSWMGFDQKGKPGKKLRCSEVGKRHLPNATAT